MTHLLRHLSVANFVYFRPHQEHSRSWGSLLHQTHPLGANLLETSLEMTATQKYCMQRFSSTTWDLQLLHYLLFLFRMSASNRIKRK